MVSILLAALVNHTAVINSHVKEMSYNRSIPKGSGFFSSLAFSATPLIAASTTYGAFVPEMDVSISGDDVHVCN